MVKVRNVFGDEKFGADGPAVYQNFYGKQVRRNHDGRKKNDSPLQRNIQDGFKDGIDFAETLSAAEIAGIESYIKAMAWEITWHNFARRVAMLPVKADVSGISVFSTPFPSSFGDWNYRNAIAVVGQHDNMMLIELQGSDPSRDNYVDFSKFKDNLEDLRIADEDGATPLSFFIESYDKGALKAKVWVSLIA